MALSLTSRQLIWIKRGLDQLRQSVKYPIIGITVSERHCHVLRAQEELDGEGRALGSQCSSSVCERG